MSTIKPAPKNIILCSDGTGNSAGIVAITNVRRLYQALDLSDPTKQIAYYDDGVGTGGSKVARLLEGVFGIGLARNVRELYRFLCEMYRPGDRIYLFGFSRGAFTVRVLAAVITTCGIVDKKKLRSVSTPRAVRWAYRCFRGNHKAALLSMPLRRLRNYLADRLRKMPTSPEHFRKCFSHGDERVEVLGLWDTVSAYGMPIDEFASIFNSLIYRIRFRSQEISWKIRRVYHALALDEERRTFKPLLVESVDNLPDRTPASTLVEQVWFPGMHSDVGGGYANYNLALVSLEWMIARVRLQPGGRGLIFSPAALSAIQQQASIFGEMHDSRSGLARIYRPEIRNLAQLCRPRGVAVANTAVAQSYLPVLHESVIQRVEQGIQDYSPAAVSESYYNGANLQETCSIKKLNLNALDRCRRYLYYAQLLAVVLLLSRPVGRWVAPLLTGVEWLKSVWNWVVQWLHVGSLMDYALPTWMWLSDRPCLVFLMWVVFFGFAHYTERCIRARAAAAWRAPAAPAGVAQGPTGTTGGVSEDRRASRDEEA